LFDSWAPYNWDKWFAVRYYRDFFGNGHCYPMDEVFVGVVDGRIVGVNGYCPDIQETDDIHWLNWFFVHKDHGGNSYGKQLLDYVIEILKAKKARKLYVDTTSYRFYKPAKALYESRGFKYEGTLKDYYGKGEHQIILGMQIK
jgi:ribosomal protein S18 acetylase RimI-like enzyme